jgi:hypothetical protein
MATGRKYVKKYSIPPRVYFPFKNDMIMHIEDVKASNDCTFANMTYSDYKITANQRPAYWDLVEAFVQPALDNYAKEWNCTEIRIRTMWFAEYRTGANFNWHTHEGCNLSAVVQLHGSDKYSTEILGSDVNIKAGDVCVFPSMQPHRGPKVEGHKICIGLNLDMGGSTLHDE